MTIELATDKEKRELSEREAGEVDYFIRMGFHRDEILVYPTGIVIIPRTLQSRAVKVVQS